MATIIDIDGTKCQKCYACVRQCVAKAIKVEDSQAKVVEERCINCGRCLDVCARDAREVKSYRTEVKSWQQHQEEVVACLAPSFVASFNDCSPGQLVTALHQLGFSQVYRVALGANLVAERYDEYLADSKEKNLISTACPTIVNLVEKHYPQLASKLLPFASPMVVTGMLIKEQNPEAKVVFVGPCTAKKAEMEQEKSKDSIDAVLTFKEVKEMCIEEDIELSTLSVTEFTQGNFEHSDDFALSGGLAANLKSFNDDEVLITEGSHNCKELINGVLNNEIEVKLLDILFCAGCIDGPQIDSQLSLFAREKLVKDYLEEEEKQVNDIVNDDNDDSVIELKGMDFNREFNPSTLELETPTEQEIKEILTYMNKVTPSDELNCGACGYDSCREKAVAVYQELAEIEMCLPYLLDQTREEADYYKDKLSQDQQTKYTFNDIKGKSVEVKEAKIKAQQAAQTKSTILILGESGTGKEMFAHAIHNASHRKNGPFIKVNCAAITESLLEAELFGYEEGAFTGAKKGGKAGKFELADQGTIFLDEVGDMSLRMQSKLLRVLQEEEIERVGGNHTQNIDIRVIAATNRNLKQMVKDGDFREDLYYRLNVITINTPALRNRIEDLPVIVDHIITKLTAEQRLPRKQLTKDALNQLMQYDWPGNVRELENIIMQTFSLTYDEEIKPENLPNYILQTDGHVPTLINDEQIQPLAELTAEVEKQAVHQALELTNWNKKQAAELLQISRSTLYQKLSKYDI
ncbi:Transcriptional regulator containing PAS, AAA-type ATPase, and DNA-binding Fis domains [Candidatus Frackibacter sp. WG11]|uniref:sigma 54-interacting transcriptional regulator n=1 Tax=Candidatus Frackibacter sp. WG11 TaxID=2017976 RepID=UPI00079193A0|nr:sigma 54-interacting transcriptional regulator [Candidatus Frackibacter sp. WG11]KXS44480.1 MAG: Fis family sigma-54 specific transcriptional regulator [Candidatus Frackibacter sp. T328-2]SDC77698.1 Transcriptional regulator containing PAS, AAA-type ATPase, and DNA-binding Fis domains [Candidatus Frackibacter sp. WG11]